MSSTDGSEQVERRPQRPTPTSTDPAVLAAEIERTREDLAVTMDAIADRVSPRRVADRTRKKVADAVATAKEVVLEQAGAARGRAGELATGVQEQAAEARDKVSAGVRSDLVGGGTSSLPPVTAVQADGLDLSLPVSAGAPTAGLPTTPPAPTRTGPAPEVLAGGALGLLVLLLLRRRRTRRAAVRKGAVAVLAGAGADLRRDVAKARKKGRRRR